MRLNPDFNRVIATFNHEEPDRVPLGDFAVDKEKKEEFLGRPINDLKTEVEFWYKAGFDFVPIFAGILEPAKSIGKTAFSKDDEKEGGVREWADEKKGLITTDAEFERFNWPTPEDYPLDKYKEVESLLPKGMKLAVTMGKIYTPAWMLMGAETFFLAVREKSSLVERLLDRIGRLQFTIYEKILEECDVGAVLSSDDIAHNAGLFVKPDFLRKHVFPWYKKIGDICHDKRIPYICHSDGKMTDVLDELIDLGFNGIHPIQPNVMDIKHIKATYGKRLTLLGNINLEFPLSLGTPDDVREEVRIRIKEIAPGGGYLVSSSNSITSFVPIENFRAMIEAVFEFGRYPVRL
jgi:uroporphyrinogen decarboxylase